jgi:hypothetical protein
MPGRKIEAKLTHPIFLPGIFLLPMRAASLIGKNLVGRLRIKVSSARLTDGGARPLAV